MGNSITMGNAGYNGKFIHNGVIISGINYVRSVYIGTS